MEIYQTTVEAIEDILKARDRVQVMCEELGFDTAARLKIATSIFELGRFLLDRGGGRIVTGLRTEDDNIVFEVEGTDFKQMTQAELDELIAASESTSGSTLKGLNAMRRLMDTVEIDLAPSGSVRVLLTKTRTGSSGKLAKNLVGFLQDRFRARTAPTLYEDMRLQNTNLAQSLSLVEDKAGELEQKNKELNRVRQALEESNEELQDKTAELQQALLSLGDRTAEISAQNRRFTAVLEQISEGVLVTDRAGTVVEVNDYFLDLFGLSRDEVLGMNMDDLSQTLSHFSNSSSDEWAERWSQLRRKPDSTWTLELNSENGPVSCHSTPVASNDPHSHSRVWIFS